MIMKQFKHLNLSNAFSDQIKQYFSNSVKYNYEILLCVRSRKGKNTKETVFSSAFNNFCIGQLVLDLIYGKH